MLANVGGSLALVLGLAVLLVPLLAPELSRPRDGAWGALVLLLGLSLVTSSERLTGSPMLMVVCGSLLIGRLATEVGQARWRQLTPEEQTRLGSLERWTTSLSQLGQTTLGLVARSGEVAAGLGGWLAQRRPGVRRSKGKRWVRPALEAAEPLAETAADGGRADGAVAAAAVALEGVAIEGGAIKTAAIEPLAKDSLGIATAAAEAVVAEAGPRETTADKELFGEPPASPRGVSHPAGVERAVVELAALPLESVERWAAEPAATQPAPSEPASSEPAFAGPAATEAAATDPVAAEPAASHQGDAGLAPVEQDGVRAVGADGAVTEPGAAQALERDSLG
jgi:hypothetical protein